MQKYLFAGENKAGSLEQPLAAKFVPDNLDGFYGQEHIVDRDRLLNRAILSDRVGSIIFFGPSGTGKTALAKIISKHTKSYFIETNAVIIGVADIKKIVEQAEVRQKAYNQRTILLLDEIHHFNRTQQDALLPYVEKGVISMIGITTENPYFYINSALISRSLVFEFKPLADESIRKIIISVLNDKERGLGKYSVKITEDAVEHIIKYSNGDARKALNAVEIGVLTTPPDRVGNINFDLKTAEESIQHKSVVYDKSGDGHYDHISAFIKSIRGSDPDAALYWLTKMLDAGEDPKFIARRIVIAASEDVGNADPNALNVAVSALQSVEFVGMPEAKIPLAQACLYVSCAPKSNAVYNALSSAEEEVQKGKTRSVPEHLKDSNERYLYPHNYPGHFIPQEYMPEHKVFYKPTEQGFEEEIKKRLEQWRKKQV